MNKLYNYVQINARMLYFDTNASEIRTHANTRTGKGCNFFCQKLALQFEIPEVYLLLVLCISDIEWELYWKDRLRKILYGRNADPPLTENNKATRVTKPHQTHGI